MRNLLLAARKAERAEPSEQSGRASGRARTKPLLRVTAGDAEAPSRKSRIATPSQADHLRQPLAPKGYAQLYNAARSAPFGSAVLSANSELNRRRLLAEHCAVAERKGKERFAGLCGIRSSAYELRATPFPFG